MKIAYWIITGLMSYMLLMTAIPDVLMNESATSAMKYLGYPKYLLPFIGTLKIAAVVTILLPGLPALKEWAYAGLVIDVTGAIYSLICVGTAFFYVLIPLTALVLVVTSYVLHRKKRPANGSGANFHKQAVQS
jgi:hypothetical protein